MQPLQSPSSVASVSSELSRLIVTTSTSASEKTRLRALSISEQLCAPYLARRNGGGGLMGMLDNSAVDRALIVEESGLALMHRDGTTFRWHPNLGFVRALNMIRGHADTFAEAAQLAAGDRVLDCTLGFGSEALIAAMIVGAGGEVVGLESVPELALITAAGMRERSLTQHVLMEAVRRICVVNADYRSYLAATEQDRFEVICFDPFFGERVEGSTENINPLLCFGNPEPLDAKSVIRAMKIASRRVLVKHPRSEELSSTLVERRSRIVHAKRSPVRYSVFDAQAPSR